MSYSDQLDAASAPTWGGKEVPLKPDDRIIGVVVDVDTFDTQYSDEPVVVLTIKVNDPSSSQGGSPISVGEERRVFGYGIVLGREFAKLEPTWGDTIGIKFIGVAERSKPGAQPAKLFKVRVFERANTTAAVTTDSGPAAVAEPEPELPLLVTTTPVADSGEAPF